jgi:CheY-like chemotaxis protein
MPHGGNLRIETSNVFLDAGYVQRHPYAKAGHHVVLMVSDTGVGMDADVRGRVFEPFFTTKELGKGTGLGLSMVYGIVKQSGGHIELQSEPGAGSHFSVYLPAVESAADTESVVPMTEGGTTGKETVLLVEDDNDVRELLGKTLERHGYRLLQAATGRDALEYVEDQQVAIDLLVTDAVLPELSGPSLAAHANKLRPGIRVLFISGYTDDAMLRLGVSNRNEAFLQKPFGSEALLRKVRQLLDATPA